MEKNTEKKFECRYCKKVFRSGKSLGGHIRIHTNENSIDSDTYNRNRLREKKKKKRLAPKQRECDEEFDSSRIVMEDSESDTETTSSSPIRKRVVMRQEESNSFSDGCSSEFDQDHKNMAMALVKLSMDNSGFKNSKADSSDNNSVILQTKEFLVTVDEQLRSGDDDDDDDSDTPASDYYMNGPKKSDSDISIDRNTAIGNNRSLKRFRGSDELRKSKSDSCVRSKSPMVNKKAKKKNEGHECPICFRVFKSGQALGGHKRSHFIGNQEQVAREPIDLNLPAPETDD